MHVVLERSDLLEDVSVTTALAPVNDIISCISRHDENSFIGYMVLRL